MKSEVEAIQKEFRIKNFLEVPFCCGNYEIIQVRTRPFFFVLFAHRTLRCSLVLFLEGGGERVPRGRMTEGPSTHPKHSIPFRLEMISKRIVVAVFKP